ncbi:hypothetical protein GHK86_07315, partial [Acidimicrobiaceae bacterium USS-CC1]|nr:hypothetical protein [Acidiferrimicrobium australe]
LARLPKVGQDGGGEAESRAANGDDAAGTEGGAPGSGGSLPGGAQPAAPFTVRHVVEHTPDGEAAYDLRVSEGQVRAHQAGAASADLTFTTDYPTATAIAAGKLSTDAALATGRLRVSGDLRALAHLAKTIGGVDPLPADLRADTEFPV